ncbi:exonuclease 1 isoform X1 [Ziziphus jujuba]|uniref:Exonuclease 1 isoform X1 n=1 Tax=Ziziphus jujuba TaxID=326968 RepID=A0ABM4AID5_ZIZJJ|nr:exonuclease 1 isoform X1 [Ziziphus jujuba var. spinosa]XP_060676493.1 exonuclease 1 isoform X1 [Ziziphus jujuba]
MGIQGLLPVLKSIMEPIHIKDLEGCYVAVDTYSWLHKGALSCSKDLCKGLPASRHIEYCMHRVNLLRHYGVKPVLVFDGGLLPMKGEQEKKRARVRKENLARATEHESNGNNAAAYECYQKAVDISPSIAYDLIQVLKEENVCYVVAPYEADAQMTFLAVSKQVDAVITEDSDLIPFGCPRIIYKMDKFGQAVEFRYSKLELNKELSFAGFTKQMFLEMCILSGCDYLQSLPGMGIKKAHAFVKKFTSYEKVIKHLRYSTASVPPLYEESFKKALLTFQHQRVYDPVTKDIVHLSSIPDNIGDELDFLGPMIPQEIAKGIAEGDLDPFTKMPLKGENIGANKTSQLKNGDLGSVKKNLDLPVQKNLLTKYFCFASLEAKRKYRAPRMSPNHSSPSCNTSVSPTDHSTVEDTASNMNCPEIASLLNPENVSSVAFPSDSVDDDFATEVPDFPESPSHDVDETRTPPQTLLRQPKHSIHKPCQTLQKEQESKHATNAIDEKIGVENRKAIVRSRYFQNKSRKDDDEENKQKSLTKDSLSINTHENTFPESASFGDGYFNGKVMKRKNPSCNSLQAEYAKPKQMRADAPFPYSGHSASNLNTTCTDTASENDEVKFGSNISHLSHYSDIAEKSMERFVSVISSFKFTSSGSRASGLRAPLKDIRNNLSNRSTVGVDFSQFAFVPKNHKS